MDEVVPCTHFVNPSDLCDSHLPVEVALVQLASLLQIQQFLRVWSAVQPLLVLGCFSLVMVGITTRLLLFLLLRPRDAVLHR